MTDFAADDFAEINRRLRELQENAGSRRWGLVYREGGVCTWTVLFYDGGGNKLLAACPADRATTWPTEAEAHDAIRSLKYAELLETRLVVTEWDGREP